MSVQLALKLELARLLVEASKISEEILRVEFDKILFNVGTYDPSFKVIKEKIWNAVSKEKIASLDNTIVVLFSDRVLRTFSDAEVKDMLGDLKKFGFIENSTSQRLNGAYLANHTDICQIALLRASLMVTPQWTFEIVEKLQEHIQ